MLRINPLVFAAVFAAVSARGATNPAIPQRTAEAYGRLPLQFEKNEGQTDPRVEYQARGNGYTLFLTPHEAVLALRHGDTKQRVSGANLRLHLEGALVNPKLTALDPLPGQINYFRGNDSKNWHAGIATWRSVKYQQVYPGIDLVFYGNQGQLEFDFIAAPGADPSVIRLRVEGAQVKMDGAGDVILTAGEETLKMQKPVVYQMENGAGRKPVSGRFLVAQSNEITFALGPYDHHRPLVIDPTLLYASYLGGAGTNVIQGLAVNANGEALVTGSTYAANFPTTVGALENTQPACNPANCSHTTGGDAFVAHISADGTKLLYSTYLGGDNDDGARAIAVDGAGDAYVTGYTYSNDFPLLNPYQKLCSPTGMMVPPYFQGELYTVQIPGCESHPAGEPLAYTQGLPDVFITKLNPTGSQILYSTYFGGSGNDNATGIALDGQENIYIAGNTSSVYKPGDCCYPNSNFIAYPVTASAYQDGVHGTENQGYFLTFVAKFSPDGQTLLYSSAFGGAPGSTVAQEAGSMGIGQNGFVAIGGDVTSPTMPTKNALQTACAPVNGTPYCAAGFLTAFDTTQSGAASLLFSTYLGGTIPVSAGTYVNGIAVDQQNNVYATGNSQAHDFVSTPGTLHPGCTTSDTTRYCNDAFALKVSSSGSLTWATNYGTGVSCPQVTGYSITTDANANVYFAGNTRCGTPIENPIQTTVPGENAFVATLSADGSTLLFGTYYGGNGIEIPYAIALDPNGHIYFAGSTSSTNLPGTTGSFQPNYAGGSTNGFIGKISPVSIPSKMTANAGTTPQAAEVSTTFGTLLGVTVLDAANGPVDGVVVTFTAPSSGASGAFANGKNTVQATTNANGVATATTFTANMQPGGPYNVTATAAGLSAVEFALTNVGPPASMTANAGTSPQSASVNTAFANPLAVTVNDNFGNPVSNVSVIFTAPPSGASGKFSNNSTQITVQTGSTGVASAPFTANSTVGGPYTVTAASTGLTTVNFSLTNLAPSLPFGSMDTPANNTANAAGGINVTGWALSTAGIASIGIWRDPVNGEAPSANGFVFVGNAAQIAGSRPDVATAYPSYPNNNWGWGMQVLTNELPGANGLPIGNGTYTFHAIAVDNDGHSADIGHATISANNSASHIPFGTIDTPTQGGTASGKAYVNFGWVLTPLPASIPVNGSTIWVLIDEVRVGHPVYNNYRSDVATLFPGLANSNGAIGYFKIDTTKYSNGLHSISWTVTDSAGHTTGVGSRFFNVQNTP